MIAYKHGVEGDTSCVYVDLFAVALAGDLLGSHEQNCPNFLFVGELYSYSLFCSESKIYDFQLLILRLTFWSKLYVFGLYVPVNIIHFMNIV